MYRQSVRRRSDTPLGDLLSYLDHLSIPRLSLLVLLVGVVLFVLLMKPSEPQVRRITATNVPGAIYQVNGGQPGVQASGDQLMVGELPQSLEEMENIEVTLPEFANLLTTARHITSEFGHYPNGSPHYGLDLDAWYGEIQYAPVGGTITEVLRGCIEGDTSCGKGWGNHVWFRSSEDGKYVLMAHFGKIFDDIQVGAQFNAGHPLGETGSTGYSSGPHVHIQVNSSGMQNVGSENPAWTFPWLRCGEPALGNLFGSACQ